MVGLVLPSGLGGLGASEKSHLLSSLWVWEEISLSAEQLGSTAAIPMPEQEKGLETCVLHT